jgi:uncharacterized membrane protein
MTTRSRLPPASAAAGWLLVGLAGVTALLMFGPRIIEAVTGARPHGFDAALFAAQSPVVRVHVLAAVATVALGVLLLSLRKGQAFHRAAGWVWVALMVLAAGSSLFITGMNGDAWSIIHLLSGWVLVATPLAVLAARRHKVSIHRRAMTGIFVGGSLVAGSFAFMPGRLMWNLFLG